MNALEEINEKLWNKWRDGKKFKGCCAFCGWVDSWATQEEQVRETTQHSATCEKHPRKLAEDEIKRLQKAVADLKNACASAVDTLSICIQGDVCPDVPADLDMLLKTRKWLVRAVNDAR